MAENTDQSEDSCQSLFLIPFFKNQNKRKHGADNDIKDVVVGKLLNHRPITIITRQSVQRLHKHMATSKAPRMPRPRDF